MIQEIINDLLQKGFSIVRIAEYLNISRQTLSKIERGEYQKLKSETMKKLMFLKGRTKDTAEKIIQMNTYFENMKDVIYSGDEKYIDQAYEGISTIGYWLTNEKFINQRKYHNFYFGHMNNFYPRYNQAALFMRDMFNRRNYPLVTYQIDYDRKMITDFSIKSFVKEYNINEYDASDIKFPITFEKFITILNEKIIRKGKFLVYRDYIDNDWQFILDNVGKDYQINNEIYDLSRLLNFFDNAQPHYGPLIEDALDNFNIKYDDRLLKDCRYRADKIIELINMISLEKLVNKRTDKFPLMFDSHSLKNDNKYYLNDRRKLKVNKK